MVDLTHISGLDTIEVDDVIRIGALAKMSQVADHPTQGRCAGLFGKPLAGRVRTDSQHGIYRRQPHAADTLRLFQRPGPIRTATSASGSGCAALDGINRNHAVLGTSDACIATYPGDFACRLVAFDAKVIVQGALDSRHSGRRLLPAPGIDPAHRADLAPGEMIVGIEIPALRRAEALSLPEGSRPASYEFAAASAAVGLELEADGKTIRDVRIALGGVGTKPWRVRAVEEP